ncbi:IS1 family transposase [Hymenobacter sediminis]|uniref:IS1 family transposase n=1 Tax=Hymenobacter sediminis TaxID=2218621 RepID=UPI000F50CF31|nr:IS1 family transposase [Hymenobacter sediminis]RPD44878.1 IS1 family transposase [Hymenobacter sediminis]
MKRIANIFKEDPKRCPKCKSDKRCKNGFNYGRQRFRCANCRYNYTVSYQGYSQELKVEVLDFYQLRQELIEEGKTPKRKGKEGGSITLKAIGGVYGVSDVTVLNWVRKEGIE